MQKFLILFLLTAVAVFILGSYFPFWGLMLVVAVLSYLIGAGAGTSFLSAGLSFAMVWFLLLMQILMQTNSDLPGQMATLMGLKNENLIWFGTALLGFLIGGFAAMTGSLLKRLFKPRYEGIYRR
jgi:hypothetical protein